MAPLNVPASLLEFDIWLLLGVTLLLIPMMLTGGCLSRREGIVLVLLYVGFLALQVESVRSLVL